MFTTGRLLSEEKSLVSFILCTDWYFLEEEEKNEGSVFWVFFKVQFFVEDFDEQW